VRSSLVEIALLATLGCGERRIELVSPWPADHVAVVVAVDGSNDVVWGPALARAGSSLELVLDTSDPLRLVAKTYAAGAPDFARCGIEIGGAGGHPPAALGSWSSGDIERATDRIEMTEEGSPP
jgi:hypothetical protein